MLLTKNYFVVVNKDLFSQQDDVVRQARFTHAHLFVVPRRENELFLYLCTFYFVLFYAFLFS